MLLKVEIYLIDSPTSSGCGASSFLLIPRGKLQKTHKALNMARGRSPSLLLVISSHVRGHRVYTLQERQILKLHQAMPHRLNGQTLDLAVGLFQKTGG